jgi:diguanylate cyclase (GGDEF)-like protein/PAS domain S-box-containing protein
MTASLARRESEIAYEFRVRRPGEDEVRHFEMRARYFYDEQGQPLRSIGVAIDVTQHKRAVEKLRISEEMLRLGQQAAGIATFTRDLVSQTLAINADSRELLGFPPGDAPLTLEDWLQAVLPEDREHVAKTIAAAIARRDPFLALEYGIRRPSDGATRYVDVRCRYSYDPDGQPMRSIAVSIDVTERRLAANRLAHAARHDALTGLPNRGVLHERLCEALARSRRGERFAVMCLDLDRFKEVNDTLGHAVGDRLLVAATQRIAATLRETDTLARLGGDEFVVVQTKVVGPNDAAALAQRIVATVSEPYAFEGQKALVGVSVGIALGPADGSEGGDLLRAADMALYRAKGEGRGRYAFFTAEMNARMQTRRSMQMDLATALERREFELHYQPIVQVASRRIAGFEALIRWRRGAAGLTPPDQFISLCEETGLIGPIGAWVLETAAREAAGWGDGLTIAVNLSPLQFAASRVEADVAAALAASGLPPARLEIEITESAVLQETEATLATLARMKARGIRIAMDDFGAGYSSLSYLQRFPFDRVKIDRGFTQQVARSRKSHAIVKAMTELCDALQMSTTAEGVETEAQLQAVARIGCQDAQGYLFSRPVPAAEIPGLLAKFGVAGPSALAAE